MTTSSRFHVPTLELLEDRCVPATYIVKNLADDGNGSLRQALLSSNSSASNDTIVFKDGLKGTIHLADVLTISDDVKINGPGSTKIKLSGAVNDKQIFSINGAATLNVSISKVSLLGGTSGATQGGAILNDGENLTLSKVLFEQNQSTGNGGAVAQLSGGNLVIKNCTFSSNISGGHGGAVYLAAGTLTIDKSKFYGNTAGAVSGQGGALYANGPLDLRNSLLSGNQAAVGGGINSQNTATIVDCTISNNRSLAGVGGGLRHNGGTMTINRTTLSGNIARTNGGGAYIITTTTATITNSTLANNAATGGNGGGLYQKSGALALKQCTVSTNSSSGNGAGLYITSTAGTTTVHNSTIAFNLANGSGGGMWSDRDVTLVSTIVARNWAVSSGKDLCSSSTTDDDFFASFCLIQDTAGAKIPADATNILGVDPLLGPLQNNGGPTQTHALLVGSPAINKGSNPNSETHDQRGPNFKRVKGGQADIGAFEY